MFNKIVTTFILSIVSIIVCHASVLTDSLSFRSKNDSLSYAIGRSDDINGLKSYMNNQVKVDSVYTNEFKRGFIDFLNADDTPTVEAYCSGLIAAKMVKEQMSSNISSVLGEDYKLNNRLFYAGLIALLNNDSSVMNDSVANRLFFFAQENIRQKELMKLQEEAQSFLNNNRNDNISELPSGLQYKIVKKGKGSTITIDDNVLIEYKCKSISGDVIEDSQYHSPDGLILDVSKTFDGLKEGLLLMKKGAEYVLYIPHNLLKIGNNHILTEYPLVIYEVKVINVKKKN